MNTEMCRFCVTRQNSIINLCSPLEENENIVEFIGQHIGEVSDNDLLPKMVCASCWSKIHEFYEFCNFVKSKQTEYLKRLVKQEDHQESELEPLPIETIYQEPIETDDDYSMKDEDVDDSQSIDSEYVPSDDSEMSVPLSRIANKVQKKGRRRPPPRRERLLEDNIFPAPSMFMCKRRIECGLCGKNGCMHNILFYLSRRDQYILCRLCSQRFESATYLRYHFETFHHSDLVDFIELQVTATIEISSFVPNSEEIEQIVSTYFDRCCDECDEQLNTFEDADTHYKQAHGKSDGYMKCCGMQWDSIEDVRSHIHFHIYPQLFRCTICQIYAMSSKHLLSHLSEHKIKLENGTNCSICEQVFESIGDLKQHMIDTHGLVATTDPKRLPQWNCDECDTVLIHFNHAELHFKKEHANSQGYILCCSMKLNSLKLFREHDKWHKNPNAYKCEYCGKTYTRLSRSIRCRNKHRDFNNKTYMCHICNKVTFSAFTLKSHMIKHIKEKNEKCPHCPKRFKVAKYLEKHIKVAHTEGDKYICPICGKTLLALQSLESHMKTHDPKERERKFPCELCGKSFQDKPKLDQHVQKVHFGKPVNCQLCDKISPNKFALEVHIKNVHIDLKHECDFCQKKFKSVHTLKSHISTHTGNKSFKCMYCEETFAWSSNMYAHRKKAHPEEWKRSAIKSNNRNYS